MNFSQSRNYGEGMSAAEYINQSFNGQSGFRDSEGCSACGEDGAEKKCSSCKSVQYCGQECQKLHWFSHKKVCKKLKGMFFDRFVIIDPVTKETITFSENSANATAVDGTSNGSHEANGNGSQA